MDKLEKIAENLRVHARNETDKMDIAIQDGRRGPAVQHGTISATLNMVATSIYSALLTEDDG